MAEVGGQPQPLTVVDVDGQTVELAADFVELCTVMRDLRDYIGNDGGRFEVPYTSRLLTGLMQLARPGAELPETASDEELLQMLNAANHWGFEKGIDVLFDRVAQKVARLTQVDHVRHLISLIEGPALCERLAYRFSTDLDVLQCLLQLGDAPKTSYGELFDTCCELGGIKPEEAKTALRVPPRGLCTSLAKLLSHQWHKRHVVTLDAHGVKGDSPTRPGTGHVATVDAMRAVDAFIGSIDYSLKCYNSEPSERVVLQKLHAGATLHRSTVLYMTAQRVPRDMRFSLLERYPYSPDYEILLMAWDNRPIPAPVEEEVPTHPQAMPSYWKHGQQTWDDLWSDNPDREQRAWEALHIKPAACPVDQWLVRHLPFSTTD